MYVYIGGNGGYSNYIILKLLLSLVSLVQFVHCAKFILQAVMNVCIIDIFLNYDIYHNNEITVLSKMFKFLVT